MMRLCHTASQSRHAGVSVACVKEGMRKAALLAASGLSQAWRRS